MSVINYTTYNFPCHFTGDTICGKAFQITIDGSPADLIGATARVQFRSGGKLGDVVLTLTETSGLTISGDTITLENIITPPASMVPGTYYWDLEITWPDGRVTTYVGGTLKLIQDVTK